MYEHDRKQEITRKKERKKENIYAGLNSINYVFILIGDRFILTVNGNVYGI